MAVFVLNIPSSRVTWAKEQAQLHRARLHEDPSSGTYVWMGDSLPESMQDFGLNAPVKRTKPLPAKTFVLDVPFEHRNTASAHGARWDKASKAFIYQGPQLPSELRAFAALPWSWEHAIELAKAGITVI